MAETKSKKNTAKVFDVAKPGKSAPAATSKPVIITHRPVLQDPMVVNVEVTDGDKPLASPSEVRHRLQIKPIHDELAADEAPGAPAVKVSKKTKKDETADGASELVLDLPPEVTGEKPVEKVENETSEAASAPDVPEIKATKEEKTEATSEAEEVPDELAAEPAAQADAAAPETPTSPDDTVPEAATTASSEPEPTPTPEQPTSKETTPETPEPEENAKEFDLMPEPVLGDEGQANPDAAKQKAEEEAKKLAEEQEKIIASGQYFLPIDAVAHRRAVRHTVIGIVVVLLLAALLFLAALDAELITVPGFPAPTDYL